jgi:hypothetical protein
MIVRRGPATHAGPMFKSLATVGAALAATAALAVSASPASAATWHHQNRFLAFPAQQGGAGYMPTRTIALNGRYFWHAFSAHRAHPSQPDETSRTVRLIGRYRWDDGLIKSGSTYIHTSSFTNVRTGGRVSISYPLSGRFGSGSYHWGSTIENVNSR